jgi:hypothetical protein
MPDLRQALKDFVATSNSGKYSDEKTLLSKFPELQGYDINVLRDFVATSNSGKYGNEDEVFSKFPEFGFSQEVKKKSEENAPSSMVSPSEDGQLVSPKPTETLAVGPMGITGLQRTAKQKPAEVYNNPEFLNPLISTITPDLMSSSEESLVPKMNYQYGPLGFKFEESGYTGNYMKAKAPNGKEQEFSLGWFSMDKKEESEKLKKFIAENSAVIPADALSKAEQEYQGFNKKFTSQKEVDESIKTISNEAENFNKQKIDFFKEKTLIDTEKKNLESVPSSERTTAEYIAKLNSLRERENQLAVKQQALINDGSRIKNNSASLERSVGKYVYMQSQQGTWYGTAFNSLLSGIGSFSSAAQGLVTDIGAAITPDVMVMPEFEWKQKYIETAAKKGIAGPKKDSLGKVSNEEYNKWFSSLGDVKEELHDEIIDKAKKQQKYSKLDNGKTIQDTIREGLVDLAGDDETTKQYIEKKKENFVAGAVIGAIESIPAFVGGGRGYAGAAFRLVRLFAQSEDATMNEMSKNPEFENISENEKRLVSVPISITTAVLEEMGFRNILSNSGLVNKITMRVIGKAGATTTAKTFGELVRNEVDGMLAKGALTLVGGALAEAETGATQEIAEVTVKSIYNEVKNKDMFEVPKTVGEFATQVVKAGGQEAIGGLVLGMPTAISAAVSKKGFLNISDEQFEIFENTVNNEKLQSAFITNLKNKINAGTLTTSEAKEELNNYRKSVSLYRAIPEGLSTQQKKEAMNLLSEKQGLEQQIENKDPALVKPQQERINAINESLNKISQNAVQEQSTDESVLRTEQQQGVGIPQVELQQVGEGNVQPEAVAEGTQEVSVPAVNEEEVTPQEAQRAHSNVEALIESENNAAQQEGYKYKDLHEQDPKLAALQYAKDNVEFLESGDFERNLITEGETPERAKERSENALKTIKQDIADLEVSLNANPVVSSKTLEAARIIEAAPVVEAAPVEEVEQYVPITEDKLSHSRFTRDNATNYEEDERETESGRMSTYLSSITVGIEDENGDTVGGLTKLTDENGDVTWNVEDEDGIELSEDGYDTKEEAKKALVNKINKTRKKEFDREAKILAKAKEKEDIKKAKAAEKEAAKKAKAEEKAAAKKPKPAKQEAPQEGPTTEDIASIDAMLDLDVEDDDNMQMILNALDNADNAISNRLRGNANDALLAIPLSTVQIVIKAVRALVKGGMLLRDAIRKVAAQNNLSEKKVIDILNTKLLNGEPKSEMPMSADNVLYDDSKLLPKPQKKIKNSAVAKLIQSVASQFWGGSIVTSSSITPEQEDVITKNGIREAIEAFETSGKNAADWYSKAIETAMAVAGVIHPELSSKEAASKVEAFAKEKDPVKAAQMALRMALAITSQNLNVDANTIYAEEQFEYFKKNGKFDPSREYGAKAPAISSNLKLANLLIDTVGLNEAENFISKEFTVKDLEDAFKKATNKQLTISGLRNDVVNGAAIFGPKIGQGFLQNLMGKFDPVTIDLWMRRTWGRWTGDVVGTGITEERMARLFLSVKEAIKSKELKIELPKEFSEYKPVQEKNKSGKLFWTMNQKFSDRVENDLNFVQSINKVAKEISLKANTLYKAIHDMPMTKELYDKFISGELSYVQVANKLIAIREAMGVKYSEYAAKERLNKRKPISKQEWIDAEDKKLKRTFSPLNEEISQRKPQWGNEAKNIVDDLNPIDVPTNLDRRVITRVVNNIKKGMNEQGYNVTNADVQALLWYPEKDIWAKLRGEQESNLKLSYDDQFIKLAEKRGLGKEAERIANEIRSRGPESNISAPERGTNESVPSRVDEGGLESIDEVLDLDVKDKDNLNSVLGFLESVDKAISNRLRGGANDALLAIPLSTVQLVVKTLKTLVKGGMMLRDAIKKVAADNNISQDSVKDILNIAPIQDGFNALMDKVNDMVQRQTARGTEQKRMVSNIDTFVRNSEVYQNATDAQKKILEREARTQAGARERRAPSIGRILGALKDIKNVSREDKLKIINQIRVLAKDAAKDLANEIKSLSDTGRITLKQAANIVSRFGKVNMLSEVSISKFVDYMTKVFADSEYDNKIDLAKSKLKAAKKNIATKIGIADGLILPLQRLFSVNPTLVPTEYLDRYLELVNMFGERQAVLSLEEKSKVTKDVEAILSKINEEQSLLDELSDRFNSFEDKVMDKDGELDYEATIEAMLKDGIIDAKETTIMKENKSRMIPREGKEKKSEEEIAKEKEELINAVKNSKVLTEGLSNQDEKDLAERLIKLISSDAVNKLSNNDLKNLLKVLDNINNNYLPHYAQLMVEKLTAVNNAKTLTSSIKNAVVAPLSGLYSRVKSLLTKRGAISEMIRRNPLFNIDQLFGNYKTKDIFNAILNKAAEGESKFVKQLKTIQNILEKAEEKVAKSFKLDPNKTLMSKFKMMTYLVQLEYESNEGNKQVNPANEYLKATIKHIDEGKSQFGERDANMLQEILDKYKKEDGSIDNEKLYNSFNQAEKDAIKDIRAINESLKEKAEYTAAIIRGDRINPLTNYVHLNVLHEHQPNDIASGVAFVSDYNNSMRPSTKAKSLIERTGKVSPLNFDVFASAQRGAKFVLMDYNLTEPIRTARMTINQTIKNFEEEGRIPKEKRAIINAINDAFEEVVENILNNSFVSTSIADDVVDYINKQGYRAVLAGTGRFVSELMSNIGFAVIADPNAFATGIANKGVIMSSDAPMIMENVGSKQVNRIFPTDTLSGKLVDTSILQQASGIKGAKSKNPVANKIQQIWNRSGKKYTNSVELIADALISTPDKLIMRPMWFGSFANTFETITGQKINFEKIASKDEAYMKENKDAIEKAKTIADEFSVMTGSTENPFMGILKGTVKPNQSVALRAFNNFNNFMTKFLIFEYVTARTAINAAMSNGSLNKRQGVALLGAVTTRMVVYTLLTQMLGAGLIGLFFDDDEEEDDKSFMQKLGQAFASAFTSMIFGRDFGNATKSIVNYGLERVNENYLDFLREGEYDPYKDAIQYSIVPPEKKGKQRDLADFLFNMGGAFGPALKTADFITRKALEPDKKKQDAIERQQNEINVRIPLEVLGNAGFIPLYKDVRKAVLKDMYKDLANAESNAEDKKKAELQKLHGFKNQTEMKRYKPELWEETFGPKSPDYNAQQAKKALKKAKDSVERAMKDDLYDYVPKKKKGGFGSFEFGSANKTKKGGGFGSIKFGK